MIASPRTYFSFGVFAAVCRGRPMTAQPRVTKLDGFLKTLSDDSVVDFDRVQWVDGESKLIAEWTEDGDRWNLRIESSDGVHYAGEMTSPEYEDVTPLKLTKWLSPGGHEWLLLGSYEGDEEPEPCAIEVFPDV